MQKRTKHVAKADVKGNKGTKKGDAIRPIGKIVDVVDPKALKAQIDDIMNDLRESSSKNDKKRLRAALRRRGHYGGLGIVNRRVATSAA